MAEKENRFAGYGLATQAVHTGTDYDAETGGSGVRFIWQTATSCPTICPRSTIHRPIC